MLRKCFVVDRGQGCDILGTCHAGEAINPRNLSTVERLMGTGRNYNKQLDREDLCALCCCCSLAWIVGRVMASLLRWLSHQLVHHHVRCLASPCQATTSFASCKSG